jgi:hypothetical protein
MKPALTIAICLMAACLGCAAKQAGSVPAQTGEGCIKCFPAGAWRAVHRIEADFGPAGSISLIGVSKGDPASHELTSVLMTAEGFVLLEVEQSHGEQEVLRALSPFDKPQMVQGMLNDVEMMFMLPQGKPSVGKASCGWNLENGGQLSAARLADGGCLLELKDKAGELKRNVRMFPPWRDGFAREVELKAMGHPEYTLGLHLLRAERSAQSGEIR